MRILLDHCVPQNFGRLLTGHDVRTCRQMGWAALSNGELLAAAAADGFAVLITVDRGFLHQQHPRSLPLPVLLLDAQDTRPAPQAAFAAEVLGALSGNLPARATVVGIR